MENQPDFINAVIEINSTLHPTHLLAALQKIENQMGRERKEKWGPRKIDIDVLIYGEKVVNLPQLKIPHPYLSQRVFVLVPLNELNSDLQVPKLGRVNELLLKLEVDSTQIGLI